MKLIKAILSCAVMLSSISFGAPTDAVTNQQFEKWLAAPVHGGVNFGPVSLSNYEADKTDLGRARWWRKKKGILSSALVGFFTVAAALFLTFLILQCFQKLQQHRDLSSSMRQLAGEGDFCVDLDDDTDEAKANENNAIVLFDAAAVADDDDDDKANNEIFFITETKRGKRRRRRGLRKALDDHPGWKKFLMMLMAAAVAFLGMGGGVVLDKLALTNNTEITNSTFLGVKNRELRATILGNAIEDPIIRPEIQQVVLNADQFARDIATNDQFVKKYAADDQFVKKYVNEKKFVETEEFCDTVVNELKKEYSSKNGTTNFRKLKTKLNAELVNTENFVKEAVAEEEFSEKLVQGLKKGYSTGFKGDPNTKYSKLAEKVKEELAKEKNYVADVVSNNNFASAVVDGLKSELETKKEDAGTKYRTLKNTLVGDPNFVNKLKNDEKFKDTVVFASKEDVVARVPLVELLKEKVTALQTKLQAAKKLGLAGDRIKFKTAGGGTTEKALVLLLPELQWLPDLGPLKPVKPDYLPGFNLPDIKKLGPVVVKANFALRKWTEKTTTEVLEVLDESKAKVNELVETLESLKRHAEDLESLMTSAYAVYSGVAGKYHYKAAGHEY